MKVLFQALLSSFCFFLLFPISANIAQADEPSLPTVDFSRETGRIKPLNGTNFWARLWNARVFDTQEIVSQARFSTVRLHDIPLDNLGLRLVDYQHIFGNFNADAKNPENYYFAPTDDYIKRILDGGSKVIYRLGTSIEHSAPNNYYAKDPADHAQFSEICAGIVRHYNKGWANGHEWNVEYWEIWNEPNLRPQMWDKDFGAYCQLYVDVSKRLRAEFPDIKIGGPALTHAGLNLVEQFVKTCRDANAPLDFFSWHAYPSEPESVLNSPAQVRSILDKYNYKNAELHLNEWHYFPCSWSEIHGTNGGPERKMYWRTCPHGMNGVDAAGFVGFVLSRWQDTPLDMSNYYATNMSNWGLIDEDGYIRPTFYALSAFGKLVSEAPVRVAADQPEKYISVLAGVGKQNAGVDGAKMIYIASWKQNRETLKIALKGVPESGIAKVTRIDGDNKVKQETIPWSGGVLTLTNQPGSFAILVSLP